MLRTEEFLDIEKIGELRKINGRELDSSDNFSWHIALKEDERLLGVARLYRFKEGLFVDEPCLYEHDDLHFEMLFRTLLLKTLSMSFPCAYCKERQGFEKYGFLPAGEGLMRADREKITFPKECGGCKGCE